MASGASDHAIGFASLQDLDRVSAALDCLEQESKLQGKKSVVTVVGAGCVTATHAKVFTCCFPSASGTAMPASRLLLNHCAGAPGVLAGSLHVGRPCCRKLCEFAKMRDCQVLNANVCVQVCRRRAGGVCPGAARRRSSGAAHEHWRSHHASALLQRNFEAAMHCCNALAE